MFQLVQPVDLDLVVAIATPPNMTSMFNLWSDIGLATVLSWRSAPTGAKIRVENLHYDLTEEDLEVSERQSYNTDSWSDKEWHKIGSFYAHWTRFRSLS